MTLTAWINQADRIQEQVVEWRRHFHRFPELSFQEVKTSAYIAEQLESFGNLQVSRPTPTSVVARLLGTRPGKSLALRADIDALPIQEENTFEFASQHPGISHACGHDSHAAMLLGAAKILSGRQEEIAGEIRFIFQHAEEQVPGGAQQLVEAGVLGGVDAIYGLHLVSWLPTGQIGVIDGPAMAGNDAFEITVRGSGGHAAYPHEAVDVISIAGQLITNLQHIVARRLDPLDNAVLSLTQIHGGTSYNSFPEELKINGTFRAFDQGVRKRMPEVIRQIIEGVGGAHGALCELDYQYGYHPLINDKSLVDDVREVAAGFFGKDRVKEMKPVLGSEDFSAYQQKVPGAFIYIGSNNEEKGSHYPHHTPRFTVDEEGMETGLKLLILLVDKWNKLYS
ncbi:carboxypeptidase Ss1. Metallo peptidase. MEROPS family M20D [Bacillus sp. OV322]|uniref:M20 metallopeptidase family protein n=1 Tax=Bacillus sp. OV322 TaxID=1882764 RepID=UPI0008E4768C|nr:amidohydrolase [Bacillus sp. OV322]SFC65636.1 carboxypeptidase Ss1. Metallo peptidase. MEROPS family M20D [Bacillus sp. OV322]